MQIVSNFINQFCLTAKSIERSLFHKTVAGLNRIDIVLFIFFRSVDLINIWPGSTKSHQIKFTIYYPVPVIIHRIQRQVLFTYRTKVKYKHIINMIAQLLSPLCLIYHYCSNYLIQKRMLIRMFVYVDEGLSIFWPFTAYIKRPFLKR